MSNGAQIAVGIAVGLVGGSAAAVITAMVHSAVIKGKIAKNAK